MKAEDLRRYLIQEFPYMEFVELDMDTFVFEERIKQKCFHCKNYGVKWTCPPRLPDVKYPIMFSEYNNAATVIYKMRVNEASFEEIRTKSTNIVHKALLYLEKVLYNHNNTLAQSFIGGSCKLCKNGCNKDKCANPYLSRTPWEATGCNVVETLRRNGVEVSFPITDYLCRYGLILW